MKIWTDGETLYAKDLNSNFKDTLLDIVSQLPSNNKLQKNTAYILGELKEDISFYFPSIGDSYSLGDMVYISYTIPFSSNIKVSINEDNLKDNTIGLIGHLDATSSGAYHEIVGIVSGDKWSCVTRVIDIK